MNGGSKKFLYTGPKKKSVFTDDDEEVEQRHWSYNTNNVTQDTSNYTSSTEFDIDNIWSIKKNINVPKEVTRVPATYQDGTDRNVGKGFYSRHGNGGGMTTELRTTASPNTGPSGKTWPRTYSYSYGSASQENKGKALSPRLNRDFVKVDSGVGHNQGGVVPNSQSKYSVQRGGRPDNKHLDF